MKYIRYTFVDVKTEIPVSQAPARNGPVHPNGVTPTFAIESTYSSGVPAFYGIAEDDFVPESWMYEMTEEQFYADFRIELKERSRNKRKQVEQGGITVGTTFIQTDIASQNRIANLVTSFQLDPNMSQIDFEQVPGSWSVVTRDQAVAIGQAVAAHVQTSFSWCKQMHEKIDAMVNFDQALEVVTEIQSYGSQPAV